MEASSEVKTEKKENTTVSMPESSERPLAYVETIKELNPIEGADVIEVATVLGWKVVVKKGLYKVGDPVIYVEIDSILPPWEYFIQDKLDKAKFRIKTVRLRGQLSQGYCIPIKALASHPDKKVEIIEKESAKEPGKQVLAIKETNSGEIIVLDAGTELTSWIGIKKYEVPDIGVQVAGFALGLFPNFIKKTDQTRIQNLPHYPTEHADIEFEITEKLEGSSITAYFRNDKFGICSRNLELKLDENIDSTAVKTLNEMKVKDALVQYGKHIALQGELIGPGIQGNIYKLKAHTWKIFDIYLIDEHRYASAVERKTILKDIGFDAHHAPVIEQRKLAGLTLEDILKMAEGFSALKKDQLREGLVFKSLSLIKGVPISFKSISNTYLLKKDAKN